MVAVLSPELASKNRAYLEDCQVCEARPYTTDHGLADKLRKLSEELVGEGFGLRNRLLSLEPSQQG
jgi:hypothetical protein